MNYRLVLYVLGRVLILESVLMLPSLIVSYAYKQKDIIAFLLSIIITLAAGCILSIFKPIKKRMFPRDGIMIVSLSWIVLALFGTLPFVLSKEIPFFVDAFFESMAGFTTTGSTILPNVEVLSKGTLLWRNLTHWFGGMGVLVFTLTLIPSMGGGTQYLLRAESPGPSPVKIVPKIADTSKIFYAIYIIMTVLCLICLLLAELPLYDSVIYSLGTAGTGGFNIKKSSIATYNSVAVEMILSFFMLAFGANFMIYFQLYKQNYKEIKSNSELKLYITMIVSAVILITINITGIYGSIWNALRFAVFQVSSFISTTGYVATDYNAWPTFSKIILIMLIFVGGCAGSTSGGVKQIRILIMLKAIKRSIMRLAHPRAVILLKSGDKPVEDESVMNIGVFYFAYIVIFVLSMLLVSLDNFNLESTFTAVFATISNVGSIGSIDNYFIFSPFSKVILSLCMLIGRLEIFPIMVFLWHRSWRKD